jgi:hypothetical protein
MKDNPKKRLNAAYAPADASSAKGLAAFAWFAGMTAGSCIRSTMEKLCPQVSIPSAKNRSRTLTQVLK